MTAAIIQAQYDQLENLVELFGRQAEINAKMGVRVRQRVSDLQQEGWVGVAAGAFFDESESVFLGERRFLQVHRG